MSEPTPQRFAADSAATDETETEQWLDDVIEETEVEEPRYPTRQRTAELVAEAEPFDTEGFDRMVRAMIDRTRDPVLTDALWDYREGNLPRHGLMQLEEFRAERDRWYAEL